MEEECPICFESNCDYQAPCCHNYLHEYCFKECARRQKMCPFCRAPVTVIEVRDRIRTREYNPSIVIALFIGIWAIISTYFMILAVTHLDQCEKLLTHRYPCSPPVEHDLYDPV